MELLLSHTVQEENFVEIYFCNWSNFYVLQLEVFADCDNLKFLMESYFIHLTFFLLQEIKKT